MQKVITQDMIDKMLELHKRGMECNAIAQEIGIDEEIVLKYISKKKTTSKITDDVIEKMLELKKQGFSTSKIAKELDIGKTSVNKYLRIYGDDDLGNTHKFSKDMVEDAIREYKNGKTIQQIAREKGVSSSSLSIYLYKYERENRVTIENTDIKKESNLVSDNVLTENKGIENTDIKKESNLVSDNVLTENKGIENTDIKKEPKLEVDTDSLVTENRDIKVDTTDIKEVNKKEHYVKLSRLEKREKPKEIRFRFTKLKLRETKVIDVKSEKEVIKEIDVKVEKEVIKEPYVKSDKEESKSLDNSEDELLNRMINLYKDGYSLTEIGKQVNLSRSTVTRRVYRALGITKNKDIRIVSSTNTNIEPKKEVEIKEDIESKKENNKDTNKQVIEEKKVEEKSMQIIQKEEIDIVDLKGILEELEKKINKDTKFTLEDKIEYCNEKYGDGKWRFLTKKELMYYLKLDGIIS